MNFKALMIYPSVLTFPPSLLQAPTGGKVGASCSDQNLGHVRMLTHVTATKYFFWEIFNSHSLPRAPPLLVITEPPSVLRHPRSEATFHHIKTSTSLRSPHFEVVLVPRSQLRAWSAQTINHLWSSSMLIQFFSPPTFIMCNAPISAAVINSDRFSGMQS